LALTYVAVVPLLSDWSCLLRNVRAVDAFTRKPRAILSSEAGFSSF
jgi:hypothetical protein